MNRVTGRAARVRRAPTAGLAGLVVIIVLGVTSCSVQEALRSPTCDESSSSVLISAQSVPTAEFVVCFEPLPAGWEVTNVDIDQAGTFITFDSDRAGGAAARFRYEESCDTGEATETPTEFERTTRHEWIVGVEHGFQAHRYYRFEGGCVTWSFDFDADTPAAMAVELGNTLQLIDRDELNAGFRESFIDEDL